jgi:hypothetical protein
MIEVSNLERFVVSLDLSNNGNSTAPVVISSQSGTSRAVRPANTEVIVRRVGGTQQQRVPVDVIITGTDRSVLAQRELLSTELPVDEAQRRNNIERYLEWVEKDAAEKEHTSPESLKEFKNKRTEIMKAFEQLYIENQVGTFELFCKYSSNLPQFWRGEVQSNPVVFRVRDNGAFFDQPGFKRSGTLPQNR